MFLRKVKVSNFKGIKDVEIDFGERKWTLLVGDNGSGKTSLLQAIALTVGLATGNVRSVADFSRRWEGFYPQRLSSKAYVEVEIKRNKEEVKALKEVWELFHKQHPDLRDTPDFESDSVVLFWNKLLNKPRTRGRRGKRFALSGRSYVRQLWKTDKIVSYEKAIAYFSKLGDVFWFDQRRSFKNWYGVFPVMTIDLEKEEEKYPSWEKGVQQARELLQHWWSHYLSDKDNALLTTLQERFQSIFGGKFLGPEEQRDERSWYFIIEKNGLRYDIGEMSSGEEAIFLILLQALRLRMEKSIILIDEPELHLNPREQKWLIRNLPKIFPDCQFILTTHSPYIEDFFEDEEIIVLKNGEIVR